MFFINDNGIDYRIDKENYGCSIRGNNIFIEGNESVYEILDSIKNKNIEEAINILSNEYNYTKEEFINIMLNLFKDFNDAGVFQSIYSTIKDISKNKMGGI